MTRGRKQRPRVARRTKSRSARRPKRLEVWSIVLGIVTLGAGAIAAILLGGPPAPEAVDGVIFVHNPRCPHSGGVIPPEVRGRFQRRVRYDGPDPRYRGKTLVFDFGAQDCAEQFPTLWEDSADAILLEHVTSRERD